MFKKRSLWISILVVTLIIACSTSSSSVPKLRDKHHQPFSSESIWNMPIGADAQYSGAGLGQAKRFSPEINYYIVTQETDPQVPWYFPQNWGVGRCELGGRQLGKIHVRADLIVPDATENKTPNNAAAFLAPDGETLIQLNPLTRCEKGGPVFGHPTPREENIYGMGITGGQGGSGLSSIGGTIRLGELLPSAPPIPHVLKLLVYAHQYLYREPPGYRWPAVRSDAYAYKDDSPLRYGGSNPKLVMGALLAIPPEMREDDLGLQTLPGKKLFHALQDYGGYIVDDTAWDNYAIALESGAETEFELTYGYSFGKNSGPFYEDINQLFRALSIVDNNTPETLGGGGTPRQPLAPPIGN
ncbi:hypothetical protein PJF56_15690 [Roseofilum sp. BLCC_M91]|uniref:Uncharacterized protein n=1 Tax=Roseofilum halophilum BLCC-M91 TaxID=3022259 RepID=A0ABT7BP87_9CYAN|nr:hypothetical protein [Roseofilum halophilum]MDJ1180306.1 hypothetical protein [Roseofilum halophilum BLCC-M91]